MAEPSASAALDAATIRARLLAAQTAAAEAILLRGASPAEVDEAAIVAGWPIGPCAAEDLIGLHHAYEARRAAAAPTFPVADRMVREGRVGKIGGVGWYRYPGGGGAVEDPLIEDLIAEEARFAGIEARPAAPAEIARRLALALWCEAAALVAEGAGGGEIDAAAAPPFPAPTPSIAAAALADGAEAARADIVRLAADDAGLPSEPLWRRAAETGFSS
ncbi:MAG: 3-hydroxyacyl-CoA dehydrogenase family protein [Pseudomonadota bacterium]